MRKIPGSLWGRAGDLACSMFLFGFLGSLRAEDLVDEDAEDERGGDGGQRDRAEVQRQAADAGHEDRADGVEVAVVVEVDRLNHLQAADGDEAVERDADAADDAGRDGVDEGHEGLEEAEHDAVDGGQRDGGPGGVAGQRDAGDGFTVGGVGAAAEEGTDDGADTVADERAVEARIGDQVAFDDGAEVLMVGNVFGEDNEGDGREEDEDLQHVGEGTDGEAVAAGVRGAAEDAQEGEVRHFEQADALEGAEVDDLEHVAVERGADAGQDGGEHIRHADADDEGNHAHALAALDGDVDRGEEGDQADQDGDEVIAAGGGVVDVVDGAAAQGEPDQRDGGADDDRRQELVYPSGTGLLDDKRDDHIYKARENRAQEDAQTAEHGRAAQRRDEREGAAQEGRAAELGHQQVEQRACARAEQRGGLIENVGHARVVIEVDERGDEQRRGDDGQQLLEGVDEVLLNRGLFVYVINELHVIPSGLI